MTVDSHLSGIFLILYVNFLSIASGNKWQLWENYYPVCFLYFKTLPRYR